jgi:hypothetical protein
MFRPPRFRRHFLTSPVTEFRAAALDVTSSGVAGAAQPASYIRVRTSMRLLAERLHGSSPRLPEASSHIFGSAPPRFDLDAAPVSHTPEGEPDHTRQGSFIRELVFHAVLPKVFSPELHYSWHY